MRPTELANHPDQIERFFYALLALELIDFDSAFDIVTGAWR